MELGMIFYHTMLRKPADVRKYKGPRNAVLPTAEPVSKIVQNMIASRERSHLSVAASPRPQLRKRIKNPLLLRPTLLHPLHLLHLLSLHQNR